MLDPYQRPPPRYFTHAVKHFGEFMSQAKTVAQHKLDGTYQPCRHDGVVQEDPAESKFPSPPDWISARAREQWNAIKLEMGSIGIIRIPDRAVMIIHCELFAEYQECPREFPASKVAQLRATLNDLYLTPVSRAKMPALEAKKPEGGFASLMN